MILTVSRMEAEKRANPGYRAFFANGFNVTRALVLFVWEVVLEWTAAIRAIRRDVRPRGHRGGIYPFLRGAMCVIVRDLIVFGVLTDMMRGRPAVYATFSSYDEVAHHSGLERADTMEALRKLDQQFGRIERARRYAPRPYEIVVLSDHGQTQGATFKQRNGYGLDELVERSLASGEVAEFAGGDEQTRDGRPRGRARRPGASDEKRPKNDVSDRDVVVLGSGNLGLVYLMEEQRRLTLEEIDERHPKLIPALREHPHVGWLLVRSAEHGAVVARRAAARTTSAEGRVEGEDPLAALLADRAAAPAAHRRLRARRRHHGRQLLRPRARRGLRVRGADLLPRRPRRAPDAAVHPLPRAPADARTSRSSAPPRCTRVLARLASGAERMIRGRARRHRPEAEHPAGARGRVHRDRPRRADRDLQRADLAARPRADGVAVGRPRRFCSPATIWILGADLRDRRAGDRRRGGRRRRPRRSCAGSKRHRVPRLLAAVLVLVGLIALAIAATVVIITGITGESSSITGAPGRRQGHDRRLAQGPRPRPEQGRRRESGRQQGRQRQRRRPAQRPRGRSSASSRRSSSSSCSPRSA